MIAANKTNSPNDFTLSKKSMGLLWCCQLINILTLSNEISPWMLAILAFCFAGQGYLNNVPRLAPVIFKLYPFIIKTLAISGCVAIAITSYNNGVLISMVNLISFAYVLKAYEIKKRSDFYQLILLGLFLLASAFIFQQDLIFSTFIILVLILNLVVLMQVFAPTNSLKSTVKSISILIIQSSILAIILFIVFPRLSPFWQVPNAQSATTGLSEEVSPGDIANLALSNDLAFRVDFQGAPIPNYSSLYWRAMTLEKYNGKKWFRVDERESENTVNKKFKPVVSGKSLTYNVMVEPSYQKWLFGLSVMTTKHNNLVLKQDYTVRNNNIISQIIHYQLESFLDAPLDVSLDKRIRERNLRIINGSNPKLEKLGVDLMNKFSNPIERSNAVLALFRQDKYFYTLQPPLLNDNSLDQFFFNTKAGFCVHYASTYTYLMRAAGIPARLVTGYLGGEYNNTEDSIDTKQSGHLSIYQYDAHAWSEIWINGQGWKRVDPTAAVDPQRVESGWSTDLLTQQSSLTNNLLGLYQFRQIAWLNSLRLQFDALDYQWTKWVLGYSSKQQYDLLKNLLGENFNIKSGLIIVASFIFIMMFFTLISQYDFRSLLKRSYTAEEHKLYQDLLKVLAKEGLIKTSNITAANFAKKVAVSKPNIADDFYQFTESFETITYKKCNRTDKDKNILSMKNKYIKIKNQF